MCYKYLLCVSLPVTIMFKTTQLINCGSRKFLQVSGGPREWLCLFMFVKGLYLVISLCHYAPPPCMRSINLKINYRDLSFLKILKYTCFYSVTGLIKLVKLFLLHLQLQKLEFEEFLELLGMSVQMSLDSIDAKLIPFLNMNFLWYSGLFKKLQAKYPDTHRCFTSSDGLVQYIVSWCYQLRYSVNRCFQSQIMIKLDIMISFSFCLSCMCYHIAYF